MPAQKKYDIVLPSGPDEAATTETLPPIREPSDVVDALCDHVLFTDEQGAVVSANRKARRFYGKSARPGTPFWKVLGLRGAEPLPSDADRGDLHRVLRAWPEGQIHEVRAKDADATWSLRIVRLPKECPARGFVVLATDNRPIVDLHERMEQRMDESIALLDYSTRLFNALFDSTPDAMLLLDNDCVIQAANPRAASLLHPGPHGLAGQSAVLLLAPEHREAFRKAVATLKEGMTWEERITAKNRTGHDLPVRALLRRIDMDDHGLYHLCLRDLTDKTRLERGLKRKSREVDGMNLALQNVVRSADEARQEARRELVDELRRDFLPALARMARESSPELRRDYLDMLRERLAGFSGGDPEGLSPQMLRLTPRELEVCRLIRMGRGGKDIADLLSCSFETIQTHRKNIRKKLGLRGTRTSLASFLQGQSGLH